MCHRCVVSSLVCKYDYISHLTTLTKRPHTPISPAQVDPTAVELELHHYFRTQFITFRHDEFNLDLWRLHFLQFSQNQTPIWHACNAIAAFHQWLGIEPNTDALVRHRARKLHEESLRQYSASLQGVIKLAYEERLSLEDKSTILLANLLFFGCFLRQGNIANAVIITSNSIQLIRHWKFWECDSSSPMMILGRLILLFFVKIERMEEESLLASSKPTWHWDEALVSLQRQSLLSPVDACLELEMLWTGLQTILQNLPISPSSRELSIANSSRAVFYERFNTWTGRFQKLCSTQYMTKADRFCTTILSIRSILVGVLLRVDIAKSETGWDAFHNEFTSALKLIELLFSQDIQDFGLISFTPLVLKMLHFMAKVCRKPALRRKIIALLRLQFHKVPVTSPTEDPASCTKLVETVMDIEEGVWSRIRLGEKYCQCVTDKYICNNHRVTEIHVKPGKVTLRTVGDVLKNLPGQTLLLSTHLWS